MNIYLVHENITISTFFSVYVEPLLYCYKSLWMSCYYGNKKTIKTSTLMLLYIFKVSKVLLKNKKKCFEKSKIKKNLFRLLSTSRTSYSSVYWFFFLRLEEPIFLYLVKEKPLFAPPKQTSIGIPAQACRATEDFTERFGLWQNFRAGRRERAPLCEASSSSCHSFLRSFIAH